MVRTLALAAALLLPVLALVPPPLDADTARTRNGTELNGTVSSIRNGHLLMRIPGREEASLALSELSQVRTRNPMRFVLDNSDRVTGRVRGLRRGCLILVSGILGEVRLPLETIDRASRIGGEASGTEPSGSSGMAGPEEGSNTEPAAKEQPGYELSGNVNAGWNRASGNTDSESLHVDGDVSAKKGSNRYKTRGEYNLAEEEDEEISNNWSVLAGYDRFLTDRLYLNANLQLDRDRLQDLDLRSSFGAGPGYQFLETERTDLAVEAGINYVVEDYAQQETERFASARFATDFGWWVLPGTVRMFHTHVGLVSLQQGDDILIKTATGLRIPLREHFNLSLQYEIDWDNVPAEGNERIDERYTLSLGYQILE
jgi:putative salt-induced outer membrane protein YdiY